MPTPLQQLRARAIHKYFEGREGVDTHIHRLVFAFCDCPPRVCCYSPFGAFALVTDWGSALTWGKNRLSVEVSGGVQTVIG